MNPSIFNKATGTWLKSVTINSYTHTLIKEERYIFKDKKKAERIVKILRKKYPHLDSIIVPTISSQ